MSDLIHDSVSITDYVATVDHLAGVNRSVCMDGPAKGVERAEMYNAAGLSLDVLPGRGMDLAALRYCGVPVHFSSQTGIVHPRYYEEPGTRMLRTFFGGFLTTCGLRNAGLPSTDGEEAHGLHGRISNTEARDVSVTRSWVDGEYAVSLSGVVREASFRGEYLHLRRTYRLSLNGRSFTITDEVENLGHRPELLALMYHINLGFPFLRPGTHVSIPAGQSWRLDVPTRGKEELGVPLRDVIFGEPVEDQKGQVHVHSPAASENGWARFQATSYLPSIERSVSVRVSYLLEELPRLSTFMVQSAGCYIFAFEPGTVTVEGRAVARECGAVEIPPGGSHSVHLVVDLDLGPGTYGDAASTESAGL